ncbi:MAG: NTP transferase domain-containing protein, partial [Chitinophagaceae bacterium]|nr:NTP transferase domain-containing protein [Chitinophagaceae bacterium]
MHTNKIIACIPARYAATRFPAKLMQFLGEKTVIRTTYENTVATGLFDEVIVITDSDIIFQEITTHGGRAIMSKKEHESGSDRIAEAVQEMNVDVIVNVQGDEPFVNKVVLEKLVAAFQDPSVEVASVMHPSADAEYLSNPNFAKVVVDKDSNALYFSRAL